MSVNMAKDEEDGETRTTNQSSGKKRSKFAKKRPVLEKRSAARHNTEGSDPKYRSL